MPGVNINESPMSVIFRLKKLTLLPTPSSSACEMENFSLIPFKKTSFQFPIGLVAHIHDVINVDDDGTDWFLLFNLKECVLGVKASKNNFIGFVILHLIRHLLSPQILHWKEI